MTMNYIRLGLALAGASVVVDAATTHSFAAGADAVTTTTNLQDLLTNTVVDGDTIQLAAGVYEFTQPIVIAKAVTINGTLGAAADLTDATKYATSGTIVLYTGTDPLAFKATVPEVAFSNLALQSSAAGTLCTQSVPYALNASFSMNLPAPGPTITGGYLNINADHGINYNSRIVTGVRFGNCTWKDQGTGATPWLKNFYTGLTAACKLQSGYKVQFSKMANCGANPTKAGNYSTYRANLYTEFKEHVTFISATKPLRQPVDRSANAATIVNVQIDRVNSVQASVVVNYPAAELEAVVKTLTTSTATNTTVVVLQLNLPAPYMVDTTKSGHAAITNNETGLTPSTYAITGTCDNQAIGAQCLQSLTFSVVGCDLSGTYTVDPVNVICQPSAQSANCPVIGSGANLVFWLDTLNFCEVTETDIKALFDIDIVARTTSDYQTIRTDLSYTLGDISYWSIRLFTNRTGVQINNAEMTSFSRSSNGSCNLDAYKDYNTVEAAAIATNVTGYNFTAATTGVDNEAEVQFALPITAKLACATASGGFNGVVSNSINITATVRVDYVDFTTGARRRRRDFGGMMARRAAGSGEMQATSQPAGISYTEDQLAKQGGVATVPEATTGNSSTLTAILVAVFSSLAALTCCCCTFLGFMVYRRRRRLDEKTAAVLSPYDTQAWSNGAVSQSDVNSRSHVALKHQSSTGLVHINSTGV